MDAPSKDINLYNYLRLFNYINVREILLEMYYFNRFLKAVLSIYRNYNIRTMTTGKYFNRNVLALDTPHVGHVVRETSDETVVFGEKIQDMIYQFLQ